MQLNISTKNAQTAQRKNASLQRQLTEQERKISELSKQVQDYQHCNQTAKPLREEIREL